MASGSKSKNKGSNYERELGKFLGELFEGSFIRSNNSGAFIGGKNSFRKKALSDTQVMSLKGDIVPPDHMPKLVVEAKFYADFRFHQLLQPGAMPQLDEWISQCREVVDAHDLWIICFKINLRGSYVAISKRFCDGMIMTNYSTYVDPKGETFYVTELKNFFTVNRQEILRLSA